MPTIQVVDVEMRLRGAQPRVNQFAPLISALDDGKVRLLTLADGDVVSTIVGQLRLAARTIGRSVSINWIAADGAMLSQIKGVSVPEGTVAFRFLLCPLIVRRARTAAVVAPVVAVVVPMKRGSNRP